MFVKPAEGMRVLDPLHKRPLPVAGAHVPEIAYWHRRLAQGDVALAEPTAEAPAPTAAAQE